MNDPFDRAPGAGRSRINPGEFVLPAAAAAEEDHSPPLFNQREPLRQPRTSPPFLENNVSANDTATGTTPSTSTNGINANLASYFYICSDAKGVGSYLKTCGHDT